MGGPCIGRLEINGNLFDGEYLADGEKLSRDKTRIVFSKHLGFEKTGQFGLQIKRDFRILIYDEPSDSFYQSKSSYEALSIENMVADKITFHVAFHTEMNTDRRDLDFNAQNFDIIDTK